MKRSVPRHDKRKPGRGVLLTSEPDIAERTRRKDASNLNGDEGVLLPPLVSSNSRMRSAAESACCLSIAHIEVERRQIGHSDLSRLCSSGTGTQLGKGL
eukprot:1761083-Rhodomonas_salina.6